jgi:hypothetical protein
MISKTSSSEHPFGKNEETRASKLDLSKLPKKQRRFLEIAGSHLVSEVALTAIRRGELSLKGKSDEEAKADIANYIRAILPTSEFLPIIDHTQYLLAEARNSLRERKLEAAAFFYVTYIEHRLNNIVNELCSTRQLSQSVVRTIVKETNIRAKSSWLLTILGANPFSKTHAKVLQDLVEVRNGFVHYKWPYVEDSTKEQVAAKLQKAERLVRYLRAFEDRLLHGGQRTRILRIVKRPRSRK